MMGELSAAEIEELLRSEWVARLGCHANDTTYVVPVSYAYDGEALYGHTRGTVSSCACYAAIHGCASRWTAYMGLPTGAA